MEKFSKEERKFNVIMSRNLFHVLKCAQYYLGGGGVLPPNDALLSKYVSLHSQVIIFILTVLPEIVTCKFFCYKLFTNLYITPGQSGGNLQ